MAAVLRFRHFIVSCRRHKIILRTAGTTYFHIVDSNHTMTASRLPQGCLKAASRQPRGSLTEADMVWFKKKLRPKFLARPDKLAWPPGQATEASDPSAPVGSSAAAGRGAALPRLALSSPAARSPLPGCSLSAPRLLALRSPARSPLPGSLSTQLRRDARVP